MNLRELAALDHVAILSDTANGFAIPLTVTTPAGVVATIAGFASDVGEVIDPQSGIQIIAGRRAQVVIAKQLLLTAGLGVPVAVPDKNSKPWRISFADAGGTVRLYKVTDVKPDTDLNSVRLDLEAYRAA